MRDQEKEHREKLLGVLGSRLKHVEYPDFVGRKGLVAYERRGNRIIFTALRSAREATSTVNAAEAVVKAICDAEGVNWRDPDTMNQLELYDVSTPIGYPARVEGAGKTMRFDLGKGDIEIDRLTIRIRGDSLHVEKWTPIGIHSKVGRALLEPPKEPRQGNSATA